MLWSCGTNNKNGNPNNIHESQEVAYGLRRPLPPDSPFDTDRNPSVAASPRFMLKVLEALNAMRQYHNGNTEEDTDEVPAGFTVESITHYVSSNYPVDGDVNAQVRIALHHARVFGLVARQKCTQFYTLTTPTFRDMSVSKRRMSRYIRRRLRAAQNRPNTAYTVMSPPPLCTKKRKRDERPPPPSPPDCCPPDCGPSAAKRSRNGNQTGCFV